MASNFSDLPQGSTLRQPAAQVPNDAGPQFSDLPQGAVAVQHQGFWHWLKGFGANLLNGATLGFGDELSGVVGGVGSALHGKGFQQGYDANVNDWRQTQGDFAAENPTTALVANIAGGLAPGIVPGGFVAGGAGTAGRVLRGAISGAGEGAVAGAGNAEGGIGNRLQGAGIGAATGGAIGAAVPAVAPAVGAFFSPALRAQRAVQNALRDSGAAPADLVPQLNANPRLMPADLDPNLRQLAQGVAAQPGNGRQVAESVLRTRAQQAPASVNQAFTSAMGATPDAEQVLTGIRQSAAQNAERGFGNALAQAGFVNTKDLLEELQQPVLGLNAGQQRAIATEIARADGDPQTLHLVQSRLREMADALSNSANGSDRYAAGAVNDIRQALVDLIDEPTNGAYRAAQRQYASDMAVQDAFGRGLNILRNPQGEAGIAASPGNLRDWAGNASAAELDAARQGARVAIDQAINSTRNAALAGEKLPDVGFNEERLRILFGDAETDQLMRTLSEERAMAATFNDVVRGSQTASRTAGMKATELPSNTAPLTAAGVAGPLGTYLTVHGDPRAAAATVGAAMLTDLARRGASALAKGRNSEIARIVTAQGPDAISRLLRLPGQANAGLLTTPQNRAIGLLGALGNAANTGALTPLLLQRQQ